MVREQRVNEEDQLAASIKEAFNYNPEPEDDFVQGAAPRFYDGDNEIQLPVANDVESLMSRAEELRSKVEKRLGTDNMLKLRRELLGFEDLDLAHKVDPLSFLFMEQLLYLDEEIEQQQAK